MVMSGVNPAVEGAKIAVVGAGIVGLCAAIHLRRRGYPVLLIDRRAPGRETSFGNAGVISRGSILPLAMPGLRRKAWRYLTNRDPAVRVVHSALPALAPWIRRFMARANAASAAKAAGHLNELCGRALTSHRELIELAGATHLLRETGYLTVYRDQSRFKADRHRRDILSAHNVAIETLDVGQLREVEPHLGGQYTVGILHTESASVSDPGALCDAYHGLFGSLGGETRQAHVTGLHPVQSGWSLRTDQGDLAADHVVVALGPWSMDLLRPMGQRLPLAVERGYHTHRQPIGNATMSRPVHDAEGGYVMAPMDRGIRITSGTELADRDAPSTPKQLKRLLPTAHAAFPMVDEPLTEANVWRGARPSFPDSLPVIGPAPGRPGLWLAFGHGHIGLSNGAITGRLLTGLIAGDTPEVDLSPFSANRWSRS